MEHHNTGNKWCIYPMYDYAHPIEDAVEGITHSICTLEFEDHRPLYDWVVRECELEEKRRPVSYTHLALNAAFGGASHVTAVDISETAIEQARCV